MVRKEFNGQTYDVYTSADWERDGTLKVQVGQVIEPDVFWQLCNSLPPRTWNDRMFQPGEPYSWDFEKGCQLYQTFEPIVGYYYKYVGLQP